MPYELKLGLIIGVPVILIVVLLVVFFANRKKKSKSKEYPNLLQAIGGKENIANVVLNGSRVSVNFIDKSMINKEKIKENGVESIVMANKKLTLVIGKSAEYIYKYLSKNIK